MPKVYHNWITAQQKLWMPSLVLLVLAILVCSPLMATPPSAQPFFVENNGQWGSDVRYCARIPNLTVWVTNTGIVYDHRQTATPTTLRDTSAPAYAGHIVRMRFMDAATPSAVGRDLQSGISHFLGASNTVHASHYGSVVLHGVYRGIDVVLSFEQGQLRYDFAIAPHSSPKQIQLRYEGCSADSLHINSTGELSLSLSTGTVQHGRLFAYQSIGDSTAAVACRFERRTHGVIGFAVGEYNPQLPLVIDPLVYASYLGGTATDVPRDIATDQLGNIYIAGYTNSQDYPTTTGAYKTTSTANADTNDVFVTKLNATGTLILYSTYLGGVRNDVATALAVTPTGEVFLTGKTNSYDFPVTPNALDASYNGLDDIFLARLSARGDSLLYATYLGGNGNETANDMVLHNDALYLTGFTDSDKKFPLTTDALQSARASAQDAFLLIVRSKGDSLLYGSYFGGNSSDIAHAIAVGSDGSAYIAGRTTSTDLPVTAIAIKKSLSGSSEAADAFITVFHPADRTLTYCSYFGGSGADEQIEALAINSKGELVVGGWSNSPDLPITENVFGPSPPTSLYSSGFVGTLGFTEEDPVYLTYLGADNQAPTTILDIALDANDNVFCTGITFSRSFPVTPGAFDPLYEIPSNGEAFVSVVHSSASSLLYSSYFGGNQIDIGMAVAVGRYNTAIIAGQTRSTNLPATPLLGHPFSGALDGFVASFSTSVVLRSPIGGDTACAGTILPITWSTSQRVTTITISLLDGTDTERVLAENISASDKHWDWSVPPNFPGGNIYRIRIRNALDSAILSESDAVFSIFSRPRFTTQPQSVQSCPGESIQLVCQTEAFPQPLYQWQKKDGDTWMDIPDALLRTYTVFGVSPPHQGKYRAKVWTLCGDTSYSNAATLTILATPVIKTQPVSASACIGATAQFFAHSADKRATIQWQKKTPEAGAAWQDIPDATSEELWLFNVQPEHNGTVFRAVFSSTCASVSLPAILVVSSAPTLFTHPTSQTVCLGATATFGASTPLKNATFQWERSDDNTRSWRAIPGATTQTHTLTSTSTSDAGAWFRVVVQGPCSAIRTTSLAAQLSILPPPLVTTHTRTVDFGILGVCSSDSVLSLALVNTGDEYITLGTPTVANSSFSVLSFPEELAPGTTASIRIRFAPHQIPADEQATLHIPVGICNTDISIVLVGKKARASVLSSLPLVDFGSIPPCVATTPDTVLTLTNTGVLPVTIHPALVASPFSIAPSGILPATLSPNQSVQIHVRFAPTQQGVHAGVVALPLTTGALCTDTLRISTRGRLDAPVLSIPNTVHFPVQTSCATETDTILYLRNTSSIPIVLDTQSFTVSGTAFAFNFPSTTTTVQSGDSIAIGVAFSHKATGVYRDSLSFTTEPCTTPYTVILSTEVVQPSITTNTTSLVFTSTMQSHTIDIINNGELPIVITTIAPSDARAFTVQPSTLPPHTLLPAQSIPIQVTYTDNVFPASASLRILSAIPCPLQTTVQLEAQATASLVATLRVPSLQQRLGDQFPLPVLTDTTQLVTLLRAGATSFRCQLSFNATMLTPLDPALRGDITAGNRTVSLQGNLADRSGDTLITTAMLAGLGNASHTPILLSSVQWLTAQGTPLAVITTQQHGELSITNVKKGQHLNPSATPFSLDVYPLPATQAISVSLHNVPSLSAASLGVYDAFGRTIADWTPQLLLLTGDSTTGYNGTLALDITAIPAGVYYCRLSIGNAIAVRSFIVY